MKFHEDRYRIVVRTKESIDMKIYELGYGK